MINFNIINPTNAIINIKTIRPLISTTIAIMNCGGSQKTDQKDSLDGDPLDQWNEYPAKASVVSFQMIVNHGDPERDYNCDYEKMKTMRRDNGWQEIRVKNDFKVIFSE